MPNDPAVSFTNVLSPEGFGATLTADGLVGTVPSTTRQPGTSCASLLLPPPRPRSLELPLQVT